MDAARSRSEESFNVIHSHIVTFVNPDHTSLVTLLLNLQANHQSSYPFPIHTLSMQPAPDIALREGEGLGRNLLE